ncbi:DASS family sodium-coupled anion symporter [Neisseriaceae bacterium B1]
MKSYLKLIIIFACAVALWFMQPVGLKPEAWHIAVAFLAAIALIVTETTSILAASILATVVVIMTKALPADKAFSGFSQSFILLIIISFLISNVVIKTGLGERIALYMVKFFGKSSLGLGYALMATDMVIAPAFASNTARSGVLYPIALALAHDAKSDAHDESRKRLGNYLMMTSMGGLSISSAMWITAMAANLAGAEMAKSFGVNIGYVEWLKFALIPSLVGFAILPWFILKIVKPEILQTPNAPELAKRRLAELGPMSHLEKLTAAVFVFLVIGWAFADKLNVWLEGIVFVERTAVAFLGLAVLLVANAFSDEDLKKQGGALVTFIWFALLYSLSTGMNSTGFMTYLGDILTKEVGGMSPTLVYVVLVVSYVLIHYFFVSQTAQMMALFAVFLGVGINSGVDGTMLAMMLLMATNFNSAITPQGSSANVLFVGSGYLETREIYIYGGLITLLNTVIYLTIGSAAIALLK